MPVDGTSSKKDFLAAALAADRHQQQEIRPAVNDQWVTMDRDTGEIRPLRNEELYDLTAEPEILVRDHPQTPVEAAHVKVAAAELGVAAPATAASPFVDRRADKLIHGPMSPEMRASMLRHPAGSAQRVSQQYPVANNVAQLNRLPGRTL